MAFVVLYDACVLYPAPLRDHLLRIAQTGIVRARWTEEILDECFRNIHTNRFDLPKEALLRTRSLMNQAVADCLVTGYEDLVDGIKLPDAGDRRVVAGAVQCGAQAVVTFNLKDFPKDQVAPFGLEAVHPDDSVFDLIDLGPRVIWNVVCEQAASLKNPTRTIEDLLDTLVAQGLPQSVGKLRDLFGPADVSGLP